jgi:uncharacterized membrane protein YkvA (DUF1232 family)
MPIVPVNTWLQSLKDRARRLQTEVYVLYLAARDPRVPWYARTLAAIVAAYALSPIDLIPDFIPVVGYLDDLIIVPLGIVVVLRLIPAEVMADCRARAAASVASKRPVSRVAAVAVVAIWVALLALAVAVVARWASM